MASRRAVLRAGAAAVAGLAGCSGPVGGSETSTDTDTGDVTTTPAGSATVEYGALSATQQDAFDAARNGIVRFGPDVAGLDVDYGLSVFGPFDEHEYVHKGNTDHALSTGRSGFIGGTRIAVSPTDATDGSRRLAELDGEGLSLLRRAIETDGSAAAARVDPEAVAVDDLIERDGAHYRVTQVSHRDYEYFTLTVDG